MSGSSEVVGGPEAGSERGRWGAAIGLTLVVLLLAVLDGIALVLIPLAMLIVAWPTERRGGWVVGGLLLWVLAFGSATSGLGLVSRGWALMLGAAFLGFTVVRPTWGVTARALAAASSALAIGAAALVAAGRAAEFDGQIREHFGSIAATAFGDLQARMPDAAWLQELRSASEEIARLQADMFPALLALQSVAALALVCWFIRRLGRSGNEAFALARLRDFRFSDQLIWLLIAALILLLLPLGAEANRFALNLLVFMTALYALRGLAVFVYLAAGSRSLPTIVLGIVALVFLYRIAFTAALLMGVLDTWLDVRRRVVASQSAGTM